MPIKGFAEPFFTKESGKLIANTSKVFFMVSRIIPKQRELIVNIRKSGRAEIEWILDFDGRFFGLNSLGVLPATLAQRLGLTKRKERFQIDEPRSITAGELQRLISGTEDPFPEAPLAADVRKSLENFPDSHVIDNNIMNILMGG